MFKKVLAILLAMIMIMSSAMVVMASESSEGESAEEISGRLPDLYDAIYNHLLEETSEYLEAGDETLFSHVIGELDENEDGTLHLIGYFTIINFDVDEKSPDDLLIKNGTGLTEYLTVELNEDGEYEVTDYITAEDGKSYTDRIAEMCELIGTGPDAFYKEDLAYIFDLYNFLVDHPEYDHIEFNGKLVSCEDLDNTVGELVSDFLASHGLAELVAEEAETTKTFQLGNSSYTIELPESYGEGELSEKDVKNDMVAYMKSSDYGMDFDVYQFGKEGLPENVADLALEEAKSYDTTEIYPALDINGINVACCRAFDSFEGKTYDTLTYYLDDGDTYLEIVFWLDGDNAEELTDMIISTLSSTKN